MIMLMDYIEGSNISFPSSLRTILLSGDWIPLNLPNRIKKFSPEIQIISLGGATEVSIWSIYYPINTVQPEWKSIPYGIPLENQKIYVLNDLLEECPDEVVGDIFIGGAGVAKGYLNDSDRTAKSFIYHPLTGEYLYRTGDLGKFKEDGIIEFLGREDNQIKIQGHRIELGEIEKAILTYREVRAAVVNDVEINGNQRILVAYIIMNQPTTSDAGEDILSADIGAFLKLYLPHYMVPDFYFFPASMPLTHNGKVNRQELNRIYFKNKVNSYIPPDTNMEMEIAKIWAQVLNMDYNKIGKNDNFFVLGGNSLSGVKVVTAINNYFSINIKLQIILGTPRLCDVSRKIDDIRNISSMLYISSDDVSQEIEI